MPINGFWKSAHLDVNAGRTGNQGALRVTRNNHIIPSSGVLEIEERIGNISDSLNGDILDLKITGVVYPVCMIQNGLFGTHFLSGNAWHEKEMVERDEIKYAATGGCAGITLSAHSRHSRHVSKSFDDGNYQCVGE